MTGNLKAKQIFRFSRKYPKIDYNKDYMVGLELHTYIQCGNSSLAYGTNVYSHIVYKSSLIKVNLVYLKSCLASLEMISIPRIHYLILKGLLTFLILELMFPVPSLYCSISLTKLSFVDPFQANFLLEIVGKPLIFDICRGYRNRTLF